MPGHDVKSARVDVLPTADAVAHKAAQFLMDAALATEQRLSVALSGGSTPKRLYELMSHPDYAARFPWARVHFFMGDDRFVLHDHADSNAGMAKALLFSKVPLPEANIHMMPGEGDPEAAARAYEQELRAYHGAETLDAAHPLMDIVLLGLGENGHTASLFPRQPVLQERVHWVATCVPDDAPHTRLTFTYPAIHSSGHVLFLVTGASKHDVIQRVLAGDPAETASQITTSGEMIWMIDAAAAGRGEAS